MYIHTHIRITLISSIVYVNMCTCTYIHTLEQDQSLVSLCTQMHTLSRYRDQSEWVATSNIMTNKLNISFSLSLPLSLSSLFLSLSLSLSLCVCVCVCVCVFVYSTVCVYFKASCVERTHTQPPTRDMYAMKITAINFSL